MLPPDSPPPPDRASLSDSPAQSSPGEMPPQSDVADPDSGTLDGDLDESIRVGSPFAGDPVPLHPVVQPVVDVSPIRYTAMGAVAASVMVVGFATAAFWWFPAGGIVVAALGCVLSIFGIFSSYRLAAMGLLAIHLFLFVANYGQVLQ
ncbi:hypothetical protein K227x_56880 [Rubripirellula lacrimiformis]|uniref:Uncharacterized protein n=2 Tax=Rubripirellula lacrimiformis TaxID=1930273 RepID=A0A517NJF1_9BACT|nr:hypothetical protein K227x_56880 [Rubripirellula lacrimiformis]